MSDDGYDEGDLKFYKRKGKRRPKVRRTVQMLEGSPAGEAEAGAKFDDADLQRLYERGFISDIVQRMPSGKEATVYVMTGPMGKLAAKVYEDERIRSFKTDDLYRDGRFISRARRKNAMQEAKRTGLTPDQILWIEEEYRQLKDFHAAGIPVPEPIAHEGAVLLMGYIGDDAPAPRLEEAKLTPEELEDAFRQSVHHLVAMLRLGRVHGDYSTFNLLWWQGKVIVIDLPQVVDLHKNKNAMTLLKRDVASLCKSFKSLGLEADPGDLLHQLKQQAALDKP